MSDDDFDFTQPAKPAAGSAPPQAAQAASGVAPPPIQPLATPFKPSISRFYDAAVAERFFREFGRAEKFASGATIFSEGDKSGKQGLFGPRVVHRLFLLTGGEVALSLNGKPLDAVKPGDVFGEMAVVTELSEPNEASARSATAVAKTESTGFSLDGAEMQAGLPKTPEFALMLMSVMFDRLRFVAARLAMRKGARQLAPAQAVSSFTPELLRRVEDKLERATVLRFDDGASIMREGDAGTSLYVVLSGKVEISVRETAIEHVLPGATFGEMAVVDQSPRAASAVARGAVKLLAINRAGLMTLVQAEPVIGMAMMRSMAERLRRMNGLLAQ
jgi:CRP/FNR family transcriptional regulator, cyclic AMP receptor protein